MIHTMKMYLPIHYQDVQELNKRFDIKSFEVNKFFEGKFPGVTMSLSAMGKGKWKLSMFIDVIELLNKPDITESDYPNIEKKIRGILVYLFLHSSAYNEHVLQRIDFRYDVCVNNPAIRQLLLDIYKKTTRMYKRQNKIIGYIEKETKKYTPYETTVDHTSGSVKSTVYLKNEERIAKGEFPKHYEKDIIRFEIQLKENHMYDQERYGHRPRKLWAYTKDDLYREYFNDRIFPIFFTGDFYKIDLARKIIYDSALSSSFKRKLVQFLKKVSSFDVSTPLKNMSKKTLNNRLEMLENLGVNPILIPKNHPNSPSHIKNPLQDFPC
ncbi:hypothetical protein MUN88_05935 [Gracilibacillus caseinilyticus]|uniref:Replication initiator protein A n=1 Tax=Gracilibacillus caseinilyticus TaxID=2932256 RepID=A0ABY4F149_9BACI|nr:hypothetical protein [Gracilibacillus caseinilyticus]UOQ49619.1 hypothetical protein MUN88_05935 [Gracilibacillus caseinilyticus]